MAGAVKKGVEAAGGKAQLYQVPETLPEAGTPPSYKQKQKERKKEKRKKKKKKRERRGKRFLSAR